VPDWSVAYDVTSLASYAVQNDDILNPFRSTGDTISPALVLEDGRTLQVEGYTVEKLEEVGDLFQPYPLPQKFFLVGALGTTYHA
jgi:hypothetical protein